jgi:hypothetical protein
LSLLLQTIWKYILIYNVGKLYDDSM